MPTHIQLKAVDRVKVGPKTSRTLGPHVGPERHEERLSHEGVALERCRGRGIGRGQRRKRAAEGRRELVSAGDNDGVSGESRPCRGLAHGGRFAGRPLARNGGAHSGRAGGLEAEA